MSGTVTLINTRVKEIIGSRVESVIVIFLNCHVVKLTLNIYTFRSTDLSSLNFALASF